MSYVSTVQWGCTITHLERPQERETDDARGDAPDDARRDGRDDWGAALLDALGLLTALIGVGLVLTAQLGSE